MARDAATEPELDVTQHETSAGRRFDVVVREGTSTTQHAVTLSRDVHGRLAGDAAPEQFVRESFRFLLEREPKESILPDFDITTISRYFREFADKILERVKA